MPRRKHWFPVSHDINSDPEVWELTDQFGLAGLRVWLELLSVGDRNEGRLPELSQSIVRQLSIKCNTTMRHLSGILSFTISRRWIICDPLPRLRNYSDYHITRDAKKNNEASPPNLPILPNQKEIKNKEKTDDVPPRSGVWAHIIKPDQNGDKPPTDEERKQADELNRLSRQAQGSQGRKSEAK